jgi:hypothetical protein
MATGTVAYIAPVAGVRFAPIEVSDPHPKVEKAEKIENIIIETQGSEQIRVVFHLIDVFTDTEANDIAGDLLDSIFDRLAFEFDRSIGQAYMRGYSLPKDASGTSYTASGSLRTFWGVAAPTITVSDERRRELAQELVRLLEQPPARPDLFFAYRFAVNQSDPVARFMFLYSVLLQLLQDLLQLQQDPTQNQVDDFIRREKPEVEEREDPRPDKTGTETVFTCLRNEVAHIRSATPERTRREIQEHLPAFQKLVKTAISRVP